MLAVIQPFVALAKALTGSKCGARLTVGLVMATVVCRCLKLAIDSPRPDVGHLVHPGNSGFPSDHSMSSAFAAAFVHVEAGTFNWPYLIVKPVIQLILLIYPFLVMFSRVYLQYHTVAQVAAGWLIGLLMGRLWSPLSKSLELSLWPYFDCFMRRLEAIFYNVKSK